MRKIGSIALLGSLWLLSGCPAHFAAFQSGNRASEVAVEELRIDLGDIKHALHAQQVELGLLEEKLEEGGGVKLHDLRDEFALIEKKIAALEKSQEKITAEFFK